MVFTPHAHSFRHPTIGNPSPGKLFRHDEARDRASGKRRGLLFHRRPPCSHHGAQRRRVAGQCAGVGGGLSRLRTRSGAGCFLSSIGCAGRHRALMDSEHSDSHGASGAVPLVQGQDRPWTGGLARAVRVSGAHGGRYFDLRQRPRSRWPGSETAFGSHARHRGEDERDLWRNL